MPIPLVVRTWLLVYGKLLTDNEITSYAYIWNIDQTSIVDNPKTCKIFSITGKQSAAQTPNEKGTTTTIVSFIYEFGVHKKPMVIHKGLCVPKWLEGYPSWFTFGT